MYLNSKEYRKENKMLQDPYYVTIWS